LISQNTTNSENNNLKEQIERKINDHYETRYEESRIRSRVIKRDNETPSKTFFNIEVNHA